MVVTVLHAQKAALTAGVSDFNDTAPRRTIAGDSVLKGRDKLAPCAYVLDQGLWGQTCLVLGIVLLTMWAATQWVAWKLGFQSRLGPPWFELMGGIPIYLPPAFFWWWYAYDAYALGIFLQGACIAASGGVISIIVAFAMSIWRARGMARPWRIGRSGAGA